MLVYLVQCSSYWYNVNLLRQCWISWYIVGLIGTIVGTMGGTMIVFLVQCLSYQYNIHPVGTMLDL
jgi:hypothetical protein